MLTVFHRPDTIANLWKFKLHHYPKVATADQVRSGRPLISSTLSQLRANGVWPPDAAHHRVKQLSLQNNRKYTAPPAKEPKETDSKNLLLAAMTRSFEFCDAALAKMCDSKLGETVEFSGDTRARRCHNFLDQRLGRPTTAPQRNICGFRGREGCALLPQCRTVPLCDHRSLPTILNRFLEFFPGSNPPNRKLRCTR